MDAMDTMKLAGEVVGGVLVKDYAVYKKWINEWYNKKFYGPLRGNKIAQRQQELLLLFNRYVPSGSLTLR